MVASAFLPVSIRNGKLHFLFAREVFDKSSPGFSDFGGGVESGEDVYIAGLREFAEETTGFFGDADELGRMVEKGGGAYVYVNGTYHVHIINMSCDDVVLDSFNRSQAFIYDNVKDHGFLERTRIFEKKDMTWMSVSEARRRRVEFRPFYRVILDELLGSQFPAIRAFIESTKKITGRNRRKSRRTVAKRP
jgi:8-oxo-dGTP pyrophosphatase MutT (NUDIX family)